MGIYDGLETKAGALAARALPGMMRVDGKLYTFVFNQQEWIYEVYEDGFLFLRVNTKRITEAKRFVRDYLKH